MKLLLIILGAVILLLVAPMAYFLVLCYRISQLQQEPEELEIVRSEEQRESRSTV